MLQFVWHDKVPSLFKVPKPQRARATNNKYGPIDLLKNEND